MNRGSTSWERVRAVGTDRVVSQRLFSTRLTFAAFGARRANVGVIRWHKWACSAWGAASISIMRRPEHHRLRAGCTQMKVSAAVPSPRHHFLFGALSTPLQTAGAPQREAVEAFAHMSGRVGGQAGR